MRKHITIAAILLAITLVFLLGSSFREKLVVDTADGAVEIEYGQSLADKLTLFFAYGNSREKFYLKHSEKGASDREILAAYSPELYSKLNDLIRAGERPCTDASIVFDPANFDSPFTYTDGADGAVADERIFRDVFHAMDGGEASLRFMPVKAVSADVLKAKTTLRAEFSTDYSSSVPARKRNIEIAAARLNGRIIPPDGELSFNETVGKRTAENGYEVAKTFFDGEVTESFGGGVCQVSTTLYNAWLYAGLGVKQYKAHSRAVNYVPLSRDAMVSDLSDLLLANDSKSDIYAVVRADGDRVSVKVYGCPSEVEVKIDSRFLKTTESGERLLTVSESYIIRRDKRGRRSEDLLRRDFYITEKPDETKEETPAA